MNADEQKAYDYVVSVWGNTIPDCMTYGRFDICDMEGEVNYIAAAAFTRKRLAEIADVEKEIATIETCIDDCLTVIDYERDYPSDESANIYLRTRINRKDALNRILTREQAALAELKRGMMSQRKAATEKEK